MSASDQPSNTGSFWTSLLSRVGKAMTAGVMLVPGAEMVLLLTSELQDAANPWYRFHDFTRPYSGWIKAGLLSVYALIVTYLISRQESLWELERGLGLAHRSDATIKGHL